MGAANKVHASFMTLGANDGSMKAPPEPGVGAPRKPIRRGATPKRALAASVIGLVAAFGAAWICRTSIATMALGQYLAGAGVASSFAIERLDFGGASLTSIR